MAAAATLTRRAVRLVALHALLLCGACAPMRSGPLVPWFASEYADITRDTPPQPESETYSAAERRVRLSAAINETVGLQLVLRSSAPPAGPFDLRVSDLTGPDVLSAARHVRLYRMADVRLERFPSWYPEHTGRPATPVSLPDILVPWDAPRGGGPVRLDDGRNELVWIDLSVPPTTAPGSYTGRIELLARGAQVVFQARIELRVEPVAIPGERNLPIITVVDPRDLLEAHAQWPRVPAEQLRLLTDDPGHLAAVRLVRSTMSLLHEHRATPVLWASFPKYRPRDDRVVEVDWEPYDRLVSGWLDGSSFDDRVGLAAWVVPASLAHPDAALNGGFYSARYARLMAAYLAECERHFAQRGWQARSIIRPLPPGALESEYIATATRLAGIVSQARLETRLAVHLPPESPRALGWSGAPPIELAGVGVWVPPASLYEPAVLERQRRMGHATWFTPDRPEYSTPLLPTGQSRDAILLAWQAYRYETGGVWIEHTASTAHGNWPLVHAGVRFGVLDRPVGSLRLKRLRRGQQDYELLRLLERGGSALLARRTSERVVRRAFADAGVENLLSTRGGGWARDARTLRLARQVTLDELAAAFTPSSELLARAARSEADWERLLSTEAQATLTLDGGRLTVGDAGDISGQLYLTAFNDRGQPLGGRWSLSDAPQGWRLIRDEPALLRSGPPQPITLGFEPTALAWNRDGLAPLEVTLSEGARTLSARGRLAIAACPFVQEPPRIDGRLDDWPRGANNSAADFRLVRGRAQPEGAPDADRPTLPTRAWFCHDGERFYAVIWCRLAPDEPPLWQADNDVPIDGAIPWGQDVVELLISPENLLDGSAGDIYCLQVKPSGLLVTLRGCRTEPPLARSEPWVCDARAAVGRTQDAWVVELSVPLRDLGRGGTTARLWGLNVTRLDARRGEYSSWSGARGHCYSPRRLGNLLMLRP